MLHWIAFVAMLAGLVAFTHPMIGALHTTWNDIYGAHSHGYLVLALSAWFAIRAWRHPPPATVGRPVWAALPALLLLLALAGLSEALFIGPSRTALLPLLLLAAIGLCLGAEALRRLAWPVLFLYFALPVWMPLNEPLRRLTTVVSQALVRATGIPVYVEGSLVHLAEGTFEIASGCSGLNFVVAALTLAAVQCTLYLRSWPARVRLLVAAGVAALVANWLRVSSLIVIGHLTGMQHYLIQVDHLWYGWALFLVLMVPVYAWGVRLERLEGGRAAAGVAAIPVSPRLLRVVTPGLWLFAGVVLAGVAAAWASGWTAAPPAEQRSGVAYLSGEEVRGAFASGWAPHFDGAEEVRRRRRAGGGPVVPVDLYLARYATQSREARLSLPANSLTGEHWQTLDARRVARDQSPEGRPWLELRGLLDGNEYLMWMRYEVGDEVAWSKLTLRAREAQGMLTGRRDAAAVALVAACVPDCAVARQSISAALAAE